MTPPLPFVKNPVFELPWLLSVPRGIYGAKANSAHAPGTYTLELGFDQVRNPQVARGEADSRMHADGGSEVNPKSEKLR